MASSYVIIFYEGPKSYVTHSSNEVPELTKQLWQYHTDLGVIAYKADIEDPLGTVKWELQDHWYNTSQIERIMKIRVFL
jgi:hypothetical protein